MDWHIFTTSARRHAYSLYQHGWDYNRMNLDIFWFQTFCTKQGIKLHMCSHHKKELTSLLWICSSWGRGLGGRSLCSCLTIGLLLLLLHPLTVIVSLHLQLFCSLGLRGSCGGSSCRCTSGSCTTPCCCRWWRRRSNRRWWLVIRLLGTCTWRSWWWCPVNHRHTIGLLWWRHWWPHATWLWHRWSARLEEVANYYSWGLYWADDCWWPEAPWLRPLA